MLQSGMCEGSDALKPKATPGNLLKLLRQPKLC